MLPRRIQARLDASSRLRIILLSVPLLDEIITTFPVVGIPLVREQLHLSYTQIGLIFSVGAGIAMLLEPIISLWSDRGTKRYWILGGFLMMALGFALAGIGSNFIGLLLAFALIDPAGGIAVGLSQAALIDYSPQDSTRAMTHWTLAASIGDLLAPVGVTLLIGWHLGWHGLCTVAVISWLGLAGLFAFQQFPVRSAVEGSEHDPSPIRVLDSLREALHSPTLLRWVLLSQIPTMVDEIFLSFATLYLHDSLHVSATTIGLILTMQMLGSFGSLLALERLSFLRRMAPQLLLAVLAIFVLINMIGLLSTNNPWLAGTALFGVGLGSACWYPIAKGQAYAQLPGHSGTVRAVVSIGDPLFEVILPVVVGLVAGRFGLRAGLGLLGLAPVFMLLLTLVGNP
jgi:predicted MFS family arabinose efflux permease